MKRGGPLWIFGAAGIAIVIFGIYIAGGEELTCARAPRESAGSARTIQSSVVAECRVQTLRWLGNSVVDDVRYAGITRAEPILVRPTGQGEEDAWFVGLFAGSREVGRVYAAREQVKEACERLRVWFEGRVPGTVRIDWSTRPFGLAAMAFGLVWVLVLGAITRVEAG